MRIPIFFFWRKGQFNDLCLQAATEIRKTRPDVKPIYVRSGYPRISEYYKDYLLNFYYDIFLNADRAAYGERDFLHYIQSRCLYFLFRQYLLPSPRTNIKQYFGDSNKNDQRYKACL